MTSTDSWDYEAVTLGQRIYYQEHAPKSDEAANRTFDLPTEPIGVYKGIDTVEKHRALVHFFGGTISFSDTK